ncbi:small metal-binding protein SmbP [Methylocystis rosea]|uniref:small metal-binding protein SmbP n=1 Tax=Methylocystis rosea TaxID=173366 RepID=UPI0004757F57|nr:small metal-binding protein SmbP [Methylocystis rosea]
MNRRIFALSLSLGMLALFVPRLAFAEDHLAEAISNTKQAIASGQQGRFDVLITSAEAALKHAKAAEKAKSNTRTEEGITHLEAAIAEGNKKNSTAATQHAEEALKSLEAATK